MQYALFAEPVYLPKGTNLLYTKVYCKNVILNEEYLWDMRCWQKPKHEHSIEDVITQLRQWILDDQDGKWSYNCGHCLFCIQRLYEMGWASREEIASLVLKNNKVKYVDEIGTWNNCEE